jgi:hypothetical protein
MEVREETFGIFSGRGLGLEISKFFGPQMALAYQLDAISHDPKKTLDFPGPDPLPLAQVMDAARIKSTKALPTGPYNS